MTVDKMLALRQMAMTSAVAYIQALASGPDMASRLVGIGYDAQSKLISSASQFYIVWGFPYGPKGMAKFQARLDSTTNGAVKFPPEMCDYYWSHGGTPWLDGQYTVWGEVTSGMENVDKIKRGEPVKNPDKIVSLKVAADA